MKKNKFKILLLNTGYFTGMNGSKFRYLSKANRFFYLSKKVENQHINLVKALIKEEKPDLICLVEIKKGKQFLKLIDDTYKYCDIETKYGEKSKLRKTPYFKNNCNAFLSKHDLKFQKHYMKNGTKKLVYEINLPNDKNIIMAHFSLKKEVRQQQFQEIHQMFSHKKDKIICGDFNTFGGLGETNLFLEKGFKHIHEEATFPAFKPNTALDLFLCNSNIKAEARVLKHQLSDHLPVILEL